MSLSGREWPLMRIDMRNCRSFSHANHFFCFFAICCTVCLQTELLLHEIIAVKGLEEIHRSHNNSCGEFLWQVCMENAQNTHSHLEGLQRKRAKNYTIRLRARSARKCMQPAQILPEENKWSLKALFLFICSKDTLFGTLQLHHSVHFITNQSFAFY